MKHKILQCLKALFVLLVVCLPLLSTIPVYAADYYCDGVSDNVQVQAALDALPSSGGRITLAAGTYTFTATVLRAIDNVIIEGAGSSATIINYNGVSSVFDIGVRSNWVFRDLRVDAGGIDTATATSWILDNITIGATNYSYSSDMSFTATTDAVHALAPTGANDDVAISAAIAAGYNYILLTAGTWAISGNITLASNTKMIGVGNTTVLNFTDSVDSQISMEDKSNVEIGNFKITGTIEAVGGIWVGASAADVANIFIHDIYMDARGGNDIQIYPNATAHAGRYIDNVEIARCTFVSPDGFGYICQGEGTTPTMTDSKLYDVSVTDAGVAATRTSIWATGYDFNEHADDVLEDITVISCSGDGAWESVFHFESAGSVTNANLIQCTANDGGEKPGFSYGAGFLSWGGVTLITCNATSNAGDGYDGAGSTLTNCSASGNGNADIVGAKSVYTITTGAFTGTYYANLSVTSAAALGMTGYIGSVDNTALVAGGYILASGLDTDVTYSGVAVPHMLATDKVLFADSKLAGTKTFKYEMGNVPNSEYHIVCGYGGYITASDDDALEMNNSFSLDMDGYFDTTQTNDSIAKKTDAFDAYVSAVGEITASILGGFTNEPQLVMGYMDSGNSGIMPMFNGNMDSTVDAGALIRIPTAGTISRLWLYGAPGAGKNATATLYRNGNPTTVTATISNADVQSYNLTDSQHFDAGDTIYLYLTMSGGFWWGGDVGYCFEPDVAGESIYAQSRCGAPSGTGDDMFWCLFGNGFNNGGGASASPYYVIAAGSGTISDLYVNSKVAPGAGNSRTWTVYKNGGATAVTATMSDAAVSCEDTTHSVSFVAGDLLCMLGEGASSPDADLNTSWSYVVTAGTEGQSFTWAGGNKPSSTANYRTTAINEASYSGGGWSYTTSYNSSVITKRCTISKLYISVNTAPGASKSWEFAVEVNGVPTDLAVTLTGASSTGNDTTDVIALYPGDRVGLRSTPTNTPADPGWVRFGTVMTTDTTAVSVVADVDSGEHDIVVAADTTELTITVDGVEEDACPLYGAAVPANANDYVFINGDTMPYTDYIKLEIAGVDVLWYQPNAIISGTALPDRQGTAQNGAITWGSNPAGVTVSMGALVGGSVSPTPTAPAVTSMPPVVPPGVTSPVITSPPITSSPFNPFFDTIDDLTDHKFTPEWQGLAYSTLLCAGFIIFVGSRTQSFFLAIASGGLGLGLGFMLHFFADIWIFWVFGFLAIAALMLDARKSW